MKKIITIILAIGIFGGVLSGCGNNKANSGKIMVISREEGSGTRGAFVELLGIEKKDDSGKKIDYTVDSAEITSSTSVMMTTVGGDKSAIGYISLGSLNDTVKALKIDGAKPSAENIKNGSYKVSRPFNIATKGDLSGVSSDFILFILSDQGQKIVEDNGYISKGNSGSYKSSSQKGTIKIAGSSSVTPVMEKLKEAYIKINKNVTIELTQNDSTTGLTSAVDGVCDIGMASRELKDSEKEKGLIPEVIAMDGIAVIVNNDSAIDEITSENIMKIYTGEITEWNEIN